MSNQTIFYSILFFCFVALLSLPVEHMPKETFVPSYILDGTKPADFASAVERLANTAEELANVYADYAQDIRSALFPLEFLKTLAPLQEAREASLTLSSPQTQSNYATKLKQTHGSYIRSIDLLATTFSRVVPEDNHTYGFADGKMTKAELLETLHLLHTLAVDPQEKRDDPIKKVEPLLPLSVPSKATEIGLILEQSGIMQKLQRESVVEVPSSPCIPGISPVHFELLRSSEGYILLLPLDDMFFWKVPVGTSTEQYYIYQSAANPYACINGGALFAEAATMLYVREEARRAPLFANKNSPAANYEKRIQTAPTLKESDFVAYVQEVRSFAPTSTRVSAWEHQSGYADLVVGSIAHFAIDIVRDAKKNKRPPISYLFVARSTPHTLFFMSNKSFLSPAPPLLKPYNSGEKQALVSYRKGELTYQEALTAISKTVQGRLSP